MEILKILAVGAVVFDQEGNILLRKNTNDFDHEVLEIFATYVKPRERLEQALLRRLKEEANIEKILSVSFTGNYYDDPERHPEKTCIPFIFKVVMDKDSFDKLDDCDWYSQSEIGDLDFALDNKEIVQDLL